MDIQSLSIVIPGGCPNNCPFCISKMNSVNDEIRTQTPTKNVISRLIFAKEKGCDTVILTGTGEPMIHTAHIQKFLKSNIINGKKIFQNIEVQTSGVGLMDELNKPYFKDNISTISLSTVYPFNNSTNFSIMETPFGLQFGIRELCEYIKENGYNLRMSINLTSLFDDLNVACVFKELKKMGVDQITFRKLYSIEGHSPQATWIRENDINKSKYAEIIKYIIDNGNALEKLSYGARKYSIMGMSVVVDDDCMSQNNDEVMKYLILRENGRLYSRWNDLGSLIF